MNPRLKGSLITAVSASGSATLAIFIKFSFAAGVNIATLISIRFLLATIFLGLVLNLRHLSPFIPAKLVGQLCLMGAIGYGGMSLLFANSLHYLSSSLTAMLLYTYPAMVILLSCLLGDETFTQRKGGALLICLLGLGLVLNVSFDNIAPVGIISILGAAVIYAVYIVIGNRLLKNLHPLITTTYICASAGIAFFIYGLFSEQLVLQLSLLAWLSLIGIALLPTVVAILFFFSGMRLIGPTNTSIICTLEPLITVLLAAIFLGESILPMQIGGGLLIIFGIIILQLPVKNSSGPSTNKLGSL